MMKKMVNTGIGNALFTDSDAVQLMLGFFLLQYDIWSDYIRHNNTAAKTIVRNMHDTQTYALNYECISKVQDLFAVPLIFVSRAKNRILS